MMSDQSIGTPARKLDPELLGALFATARWVRVVGIFMAVLAVWTALGLVVGSLSVVASAFNGSQRELSYGLLLYLLVVCGSSTFALWKLARWARRFGSGIARVQSTLEVDELALALYAQRRFLQTLALALCSALAVFVLLLVIGGAYIAATSKYVAA